MPSSSSYAASAPRTPRTPASAVGKKKKLTLKDLEAPRSVGGSPRPSMKLAPDFDPKRHSVLVYEQRQSLKDFVIQDVPGKRQGVWKLGYQATVSPTELWMFRNDDPDHDLPKHLEGSKHIHGVWGLDPTCFDPGQTNDELPDTTTMNPLHLWFYPPKATLPKYFVPRGIWTYPQVKRDISQLSPEQAGFLHVTGNTPKTNKLDVGGSWKLLYRRDGLPEAPLGPGLSPKKEKARPSYITVHVITNAMTPNMSRERVTMEKLLPKEETLDGIKDRVYQKKGIPKAWQHLTYKGTPLDDDSKTLKEYNIRDQAELYLEPMDVHVQLPNGKVVSVPIDPTDTTRDLKEKLQDRHNIPVQDQRLETKDGTPLKDPSRLKDLGVRPGDTIQMKPMEIQVELPHGKIVTLVVDPKDTVQDVKTQLQDRHGIPVPDQRLENEDGVLLNNPNSTLKDLGVKHGDTLRMKPMQVMVRDVDGREFTITTDPSDTVDDLKKKIERQEDIPKSDQRLVFGTQPLTKDHKTLRDYGIQHGDLLDLAPIQIKVELPNGKVVTVPGVRPNDTVQDLKAKLENKHGIPVADQRLEKDGWPLNDNDTTMKDLGVKHGDLIRMPPMQVTVCDVDGREFTIPTDPSETIDDLKNKIDRREQIPKKDQRLVFGAKPLDKDHKTLRSYGIKHGSILDLTPMEIKVETPDGKRLIPVQVSPNDTIADVKTKVEDKEGIPAEDQVLQFHGKELSDATTLKDNGIEHGDTLQLAAAPAPSGMKIFVKDWKHKTTKLDVQPSDTIQSIRERLAPIKDLDPDKQILIYEETTMLDDGSQTLDDYKIPDGATIQLDRFKIYVEVPTIGKFLMECEPSWKLKRIQDAVESRFKIKPDMQQAFYQEKELPTDTTSAKSTTIEEAGIPFKATVVVKEKNVPEYDVKISAWQDPFRYTPTKSPKKKVGVRKKTTYDRSKDLFMESKKETALTVDIWDQKEE